MLLAAFTFSDTPEGMDFWYKLKDKLKKYRSTGLEDGGEFSNENLVFKVLRRNGYIQKLFDFQIKNTDKNLSLKERYLFNK